MPLQGAGKRLRDTRPIYRTRDGKRVPSVTTVLGVIAKPWLVQWANRLGLQGINSTEYVDQAAGAGSLTHAAIDAAFRGEALDAALVEEFSEEERAAGRNAWRRFTEWRAAHAVEPLLTEHQMVSERLHVGGTLDFFAVVNGRRTIVDFKTSSSIYDSHLIQLSAYRSLLEEAGTQVDEVRVVTLPRDPDVRGRQAVVTDTAPYLEVFERALDLYRAQTVLGREERRRREHEKQEVEKERVEAQLAEAVAAHERQEELFARFKR